MTTMDKYTGLTQEHFDVLVGRYKAFKEVINDPTTDPVKVFDPLSKRSMDEIYMIREVSKELQRKKEEDAKKAAQAAEEQAQAAEEKAQATDEQAQSENQDGANDVAEKKQTEKC